MQLLSCMLIAFGVLFTGNAIICEERLNCKDCITEFEGTLCGWCADNTSVRVSNYMYMYMYLIHKEQCLIHFVLNLYKECTYLHKQVHVHVLTYHSVHVYDHVSLYHYL